MSITSQDIVPFNKARADLTRLTDEVRAGHEKIITRNGESFVALVDARKLDYYHRLEREALARANVQLGLLNDVAAGLQDIRAGKAGPTSTGWTRLWPSCSVSARMPRRRRCWIRLTTPCPSVWRSHRVSGAGSSPAIPRYPKY